MTKDKALEQGVEALENIDRWLPTIGQKGLRDYESDALNAMKEALAQPAQEPVAWISHNAGLYHFKPDDSLDPLPLYLALPAAQPRPWVGLTDEEIIMMSRYDLEYAALIGEVGRKLKEKNT